MGEGAMFKEMKTAESLGRSSSWCRGVLGVGGRLGGAHTTIVI